MKKLLIVLMLLLAYALLGQGLWEVTEFDLASASTGADTSSTFQLYPYMTIGYAAFDTSGDDSVDIDLVLQVSADSWVEVMGSVQWVTFETWTISSDSVFAHSVITDNPVPNYKKGRVIATGGSDNKIDSYTLTEGYIAGWHQSGRY